MKDPLYYHARVNFEVLIETKKAFRIKITRTDSYSMNTMIRYYEDVCKPLEVWVPKKWVIENYIWHQGLYSNIETMLQKRRKNKIKELDTQYEMEQIISIPQDRQRTDR